MMGIGFSFTTSKQENGSSVYPRVIDSYDFRSQASKASGRGAVPWSRTCGFAGPNCTIQAVCVLGVVTKWSHTIMAIGWLKLLSRVCVNTFVSCAISMGAYLLSCFQELSNSI